MTTTLTKPEESAINQSTPQYWDSMVQDFDAIYTGEGRNPLSAALDKWLRKDIYDRVAETARLIHGLGANQQVLDVGVGTGRLCVPLGKNGHHIVGVDFSPQMLEQAKRVVQQAGVAERCTFYQGDMVHGIPNELDAYPRFDAVAILGVLDYISDPVPMMSRIVQRFQPKIMVGSFPREGTFRSWVRRLRYKVQGLDCPLYFFTPSQIEAMGKAMGAKGTKQQVMGELHFTVFEF